MLHGLWVLEWYSGEARPVSSRAGRTDGRAGPDGGGAGRGSTLRVVVATPANCGWVGRRQSGPRGRAAGAVAGWRVVGFSNAVLSCPMVE